MATNTIKTRIQLKNDTEAHWDLAVNFVPKEGEVIIYSADDTHPFSRLKVGNGSTTVNRLDYIPNRGNILIYTDKETLNDNTTVPGIKIGDGLAYGIDLPFVGDDIAEDLLSHINNTTVHITAAERTKWNNKINCEDSVSAETLILTRL